jgi:xylitol oxidase
MAEGLRNWAGNYTFSAPKLERPATVEQLQELIARGGKLKAQGARHSFNDIADSPETVIALDRFDRVLAIDAERRTVTIEAGVRYGELCGPLHEAGYALHNLASLPHISVAGACATATHGSGVANRNLSTAVAAMELVTADGELVVVSREQHGDQFAGMVVGLGGLGVVTKLTLDVVPTFTVRQDVYENLPLAQLEQHVEAILGRGYSVSLFTDWRGSRFNQVWVKSHVTDGAPFEAEPELFGATLATTQLHPIPGISGKPCTPQLGAPGPWHERLPHFRMDFTPSSGDELQSEYFVAREHGYAALCAIDRISEQVASLVQISEIRTIAADDLWMSPCYRQDCLALHFTWKQDWPAVRELLPLLEQQLAPLDARPHWGKLFTITPARLAELYPKLPEFRALLRSYDPRGVFRNAFLDAYIFAES